MIDLTPLLTIVYQHPYEPNSVPLKMEVACSSIHVHDPVWCNDAEDLPFACTCALKAKKIRLFVVCKMQGMPGKFYLIHWHRN